MGCEDVYTVILSALSAPDDHFSLDEDGIDPCLMINCAT